MARKIIYSLLFVFFILALILSLAGIDRESFHIGVRAYVKSVTSKFNDLKSIEIPKVPTFNTTFDGAWYSIVIDVIKFIANLFVGLCNLIITLVNFVNSLFSFAWAVNSALFSITDFMPLTA